MSNFTKKKLDSDGLWKKYNVIINSSDLASAKKDRIAEVSKNIKIDGFRPGKVPEAHIEKIYGETIFAEIVEKMINKVVPDIVKDGNYKIASRPKIDMISKEMNDKNNLEFNVAFEVFPEIPEIKYDKIKIENYICEINDKDIEEQINQIRLEHAKYETSEETKYKATEGDIAVIDFTGYVDGEAFEGGKGENYELRLGSKTFIDDFEEQLVGLRAGSDKKVKVKFPNAYGKKELAGKKAEFEVVVKSIKTPKLSDLNEEFFQQFDTKNLEEFRNFAKNLVQSKADEFQSTMLRNSIFDALYENVNFPIPETFLNDDHHHDHEHGEDCDHPTHKKDKKTLAKEMEEKKRYIHSALCVSKISEAENIKVEQNDLREHIRSRFPFLKEDADVDNAIQHLVKSQDMLNNMIDVLLKKKIVDFIKKKVTMKDKFVSLNGLEKLFKDLEFHY